MIGRIETEIDLLERHFNVLLTIIENEPIGIVRLSNETGYPHHKIRYSLRNLEERGIIEPTQSGAVTTENTPDFIATQPERIDTVIEQLQEMKHGSDTPLP